MNAGVTINLVAFKVPCTNSSWALHYEGMTSVNGSIGHQNPFQANVSTL